MIPEGIPVLGGVGLIGVPFGELIGLEIICGGANAIPAANIFEYVGFWYVLGQSDAFQFS